ncbi:MAG: hypothetical protein HQK89_05195 [Nitrospirae bacterium]|nr:hypothetical protein [Nitrospirota bacterium]
MMKPDAVHVKPLELYDDKQFAVWLRTGFEDIHHKTARLKAFSPLHYFVGQLDDLTDELKNIYNMLSSSAQTQFRLGIAIALLNLPSEFRYVQVVRELLHLAGRVHADEILNSAVQQVGNGFFGMSEHDEGREIFALTLNIVAGLSPAKGVGDALRRLVASTFFRYNYSPMAFIALCRAEPEDFPAHLTLLRNCFTRLHRENGTTNAYLTANQFVHYVDPSVIAKNLCRCSFSRNSDIDPFKADNWLVKELFSGDKSPLSLVRKDKSYAIARSGQEQGMPQWEINMGNVSNFNLKKLLDNILVNIQKVGSRFRRFNELFKKKIIGR